MNLTPLVIDTPIAKPQSSAQLYKYVEIEPLALEAKNGSYIRKCYIKRIDEGTLVRQEELWFQFNCSVKLPEEDDCDSYLIAIILMAMKERRNIHVKGSVSRHLLSNLVEYQAVWSRWLPTEFKYVNIVADSVRHDGTIKSGAICAFSGGVDGTFSVWQHTQRKCGYRSQEIKLCVIVHGFDIPLGDEAAFLSASKKAQETLDDTHLKLVTVKTNYREILNLNWEYSVACALVAVLSNFKNIAGTCMIGSSDSYESLIVPFGSSPITDYLLSSGSCHVMHDGASHSRTEKVKEIARWKMGMKNLRVCWQGNLRDRNCGKCEKCLRTKFNFLAAGVDVPACFPTSTIFDDLRNVAAVQAAIYRDTVYSEWQQICQQARENDVDAFWLPELTKLIAKKRTPMLDYVLPRGSVRRRYAKKLAGKIPRIRQTFLYARSVSRR